MEMISTILGEFTPIEIILLVFILSSFFILYQYIKNDDYFTELNEIKQTKRAELWNYISGELQIIESISYDRVSKLVLNSDQIKPCNNACGYSSKESILTTYSCVLERVLQSHIFENIKTMIRINHFHDKTGSDLQSYIDDGAEVLLNKSRKLLSERMGHVDILRGTSEYRFSLEEAKKFFGKIIRKAIENKREERKEVEILKQKYSVLHKLNFFRFFAKKEDES